MEELLINSGMRETRAVILVDGVLEDIWIERRTSKGLVGNIYKAHCSHKGSLSTRLRKNIRWF